MEDKIKFKKVIALMDNHYLFRKGFEKLLAEYKHLSVLFEAENHIDLLEKLKVRQPDIIFFGLDLPSLKDFETVQVVKEKYPSTKIIILSSCYEEELAFSLMERGISAFLSKDTHIEEIIKAINSVLEKGYYFDFEISKAMAKGLHWSHKKTLDIELPKLSKRETEVVQLICKQHTNKEIADILCLSPRTIDTYRESIFQKTGAKNIVGIALFAFQNRLVRFNLVSETRKKCMIFYEELICFLN